MSDQDFGIHFESEWPLIQELRDAAAREQEKAPQMTITEFLEARIAEDEAAIERRQRFPHSMHSMDEVGTYNPNCPDCLGLPGKARVLAECKAKRAIIGHAREANEAEKEFDDYEWQGTVERSEPLTGDAILFALAAVYKDHPDYQQEWAPDDTPKKV